MILFGLVWTGAVLCMLNVLLVHPFQAQLWPQRASGLHLLATLLVVNSGFHWPLLPGKVAWRADGHPYINKQHGVQDADSAAQLPHVPGASLPLLHVCPIHGSSAFVVAT